MFTIILKQAGFRRTFTPIIVQTREFKRDVAPCDLDANHPDNPLNKNNEKEKDEKEKDKEMPLWIHNNFGLDIPDGTYIH